MFLFSRSKHKTQEPAADPILDAIEKDLSTSNTLVTRVHRDLIVEDNDVNRSLFQRTLKRMSIESDTAHNGYDAIRKAARTQYDVIWMDVKMPGCDGLTATRFLRKKCGYKGPIYGTTGFSDCDSHAIAKESGMNDVIDKPFSIERIMTIHKHLHYKV